MNKDEAAAAIRVIRKWENYGYLASTRIAQGESASKVTAELDAEFDAEYWGAINEVRTRPWWQRLGNLFE